jgi:hypothetical protein
MGVDFQLSQRIGWGLIALFSSVICLTTCGCGRGISKPKELTNLAPVAGKVLFRGEPPVGAVLTLIPTVATPENATNLATTATVGADGKFSVQTLVAQGTANGAAPGEYAIAISWTKPVRPDDRDSDDGPELLPKKYRDVKTSGLKAEIKPGRNELPPWELNP